MFTPVNWSFPLGTGMGAAVEVGVLCVDEGAEEPEVDAVDDGGAAVPGMHWE